MFKHLIKSLFPLTMVGEDGGGGGTEWVKSLPDAVKDWDEVKNSDSQDKFWGQMTNMRSRLGQSIRVPGDDAGKEDWAEFNQKLVAKVPNLMPKPDASDAERMAEVYKVMGKPEEAGKYASPEGLKFVAGDTLVALQKQAHALHLNNEQFAVMAKDIEGKLSERSTSATEQVEANKTALKTEWGVAFDANYNASTKYLEDTNAPKELREGLKAGTLTPETVKWVHSQFEATKGEGSGAASDSSTGDVITPAEAKLQISAIMNNKEHAYWNPRDPANKVAMQRMVKLHKLAKG